MAALLLAALAIGCSADPDGIISQSEAATQDSSGLPADTAPDHSGTPSLTITADTTAMDTIVIPF